MLRHLSTGERIRRSDVLLAAALTLVAQLALAVEPMAGSGTRLPSMALLVPLTALMTVPAVWRRPYPLPALAVAGLAEVAAATAGYGISVGAIVVWALLGSAALHTDARTTIGLALLGAVAVTAGVYVANPFTRDLLSLLTTAAVGALPPVIGDALRRQRELTAEVLRLRAAELEAATRAERVRIARDLHDTVGHHLGAIGLRARAAELDAADGDAEEAAEALGAIGRLSDRALEDTRVLLGVLRDDDDPDLRPTPGLGDLDELAETARLAGVSVTVSGAPGELPDAISTCAYRIVQEALTNVAKHAAPAAASVVVRRAAGRLQVTVTDDGGLDAPSTAGRPAAAAAAAAAAGVVEVVHPRRGQARPPRPGAGSEGGGLGLAGMRERARAVGGTVSASPGPDGGWRVHADLPDAL